VRALFTACTSRRSARGGLVVPGVKNGQSRGLESKLARLALLRDEPMTPALIEELRRALAMLSPGGCGGGGTG